MHRLAVIRAMPAVFATCAWVMLVPPPRLLAAKMAWTAATWGPISRRMSGSKVISDSMELLLYSEGEGVAGPPLARRSPFSVWCSLDRPHLVRLDLGDGAAVSLNPKVGPRQGDFDGLLDQERQYRRPVAGLHLGSGQVGRQ